MQHQDRQKQIQFWVGVGISLLCLGVIFVFIRPGEILAALKTARYDYLALSGLGILGFMILRAVRWRFMLNNQVTWAKVFHIQNIGYMLTYILPFRIGDVARAVLIGNVPPVTLPQGLSTMVVERVLDLLFIVTLLPITLAEIGTVPAEVQSAGRIAAILALIAILILIIAANQRPLVNRIVLATLPHIPRLHPQSWAKRIDDILLGLDSLTRLKDGLILLGLSILVWLPILFAYDAALQAVHIQPTWAMSGFVVCMAALSIAAPSSPGQVGVFEAGVTFALVTVLGQPEAESVSFAFLYHLLNFIAVMILGAIGVYGLGSTFSTIIQSAQNLMRKSPSKSVKQE